MIVVRRSHERHHDQHDNQDVWRTFYPQACSLLLADGFGTLETLNEERVSPGAAVSCYPKRDGEVVTYVHEGAIAYHDPMGRPSTANAGEFQRMASGPLGKRRDRNASRTRPAHFFQIQLCCFHGLSEPGHRQKRFSAAQRRGTLCVVASPDGRSGSLRVDHDVVIYSALLDPGQHVVHELSTGHSAWLHLVQGEATLIDIDLTTGDGAGLQSERAVSLTALEQTEVLLLDLGDSPTSPRTNGVA